MKNFKLTKLIAGALVVVSALALNPIGASAAWKENNSGWWYTEGNSWATGWRNIDGNWYYFYPDNGYMAIQTTVGNCYVNRDGAWVDDSSFNITASKAEQLIRQKYYPGTSQTKPYTECCDFDGSKWIVRAFEDNEFKTTNIGWYYVDKNTGNISSMY